MEKAGAYILNGHNTTIGILI